MANAPRDENPPASGTGETDRHGHAPADRGGAWRVRPATEADLAAIHAIYSHYVLGSTATFEVDPPSRDELAARRSVIVALGLPYLAAERDGALAGYAYAGPYRPRPAYQFTVEDSIYVHPDYAGRGCGRALLAELIDACELAGRRQMVAVIGDSANVASAQLHDRFGFRRVGTLRSVGFKFDRWVDTVLMQRGLVPRTGAASG